MRDSGAYLDSNVAFVSSACGMISMSVTETRFGMSSDHDIQFVNRAP